MEEKEKDYEETIEIFSREKELKGQIGKAVTFVFCCYGLVLAGAIAIFLLQGFHAWGFDLDMELIRYLLLVVIGELVSMTWLVYKRIFS